MMDWRALGAVGAGAAIGGVLRYLVNVWTVARFGVALGWIGTGLINISGAFLIGIVVEAGARSGVLTPLLRLFLATGILGGYTTFSTFALETLTLGLVTSRWLALAYAAGSVVLGVAAAAAGAAVVRLAVR